MFKLRFPRDMRSIFVASVIAVGLLVAGVLISRKRESTAMDACFAWAPDPKGKLRNQMTKSIIDGKGLDGRFISQWSTRERAQALLAAVVYTSPNTVQRLINYGLDLNSKEECDITALHMAVGIRRADMVHTLLRNGASPYVRVANETPMDLMYLPAKSNHRVGTDEDIVNSLARAQEDFDRKNSSHSTN